MVCVFADSVAPGALARLWDEGLVCRQEVRIVVDFEAGGVGWPTVFGVPCAAAERARVLEARADDFELPLAALKVGGGAALDCFGLGGAAELDDCGVAASASGVAVEGYVKCGADELHERLLVADHFLVAAPAPE